MRGRTLGGGGGGHFAQKINFDPGEGPKAEKNLTKENKKNTIGEVTKAKKIQLKKQKKDYHAQSANAGARTHDLSLTLVALYLAEHPVGRDSRTHSRYWI